MQQIDNYGVSGSNAKWVVDYWFLAYGKNVLHKSVSIPIREMGRETNKEAEYLKQGDEYSKKEDRKQMEEHHQHKEIEDCKKVQDVVESISELAKGELQESGIKEAGAVREKKF